MVEWRTVRYQTGGLMLLASLLLMPPLCGLMFDCGCTWPWEGLDSHCNIHDSTALQQCPWCVSLLAGVVSVSLAVLCGVLLSMSVPEASIVCSRGIYQLTFKPIHTLYCYKPDHDGTGGSSLNIIKKQNINGLFKTMV